MSCAKALDVVGSNPSMSCVFALDVELGATSFFSSMSTERSCSWTRVGAHPHEDPGCHGIPKKLAHRERLHAVPSEADGLVPALQHVDGGLRPRVLGGDPTHSLRGLDIAV